jgi:hypothetical protein
MQLKMIDFLIVATHDRSSGVLHRTPDAKCDLLDENGTICSWFVRKFQKS